MHTWLPDAHSEAPTPISGMLSGSLLAVSFYAVLRYFQVAAAALGPPFPRGVLLVFGVLSLVLAAAAMLEQRNLKRLLAYSSVEHMGILAVGVAFGAPTALAGVLLHVLGARGRQGQRVLRRGRAGADLRHEGHRPHPGGAGPAALERAAVPDGRAGAVGDAALRAVPQRVPDRRRWPAGSAGRARGRCWSCWSPWPSWGCRSPRPGCCSCRDPRRRAPRGRRPGSPAPGWWCPSWPGVVVLVVLGLHPPAVLADLVGRAAICWGVRHEPVARARDGIR